MSVLKAPETCRYFIEHFRTSQMDSGSVFRIVNEKNAQMRQRHPIQVVQMGLRETARSRVSQPGHESTKHTGLKHFQWSVSAAREGLGNTYPSFFICMRDEPQLDFGGQRHPDGHGFSVFGMVRSGTETIRKIYAKAEDGEYLQRPIPFLKTEIIG